MIERFGRPLTRSGQLGMVLLLVIRAPRRSPDFRGVLFPALAAVLFAALDLLRATRHVFSRGDPCAWRGGLLTDGNT